MDESEGHDRKLYTCFLCKKQAFCCQLTYLVVFLSDPALNNS